MLQLQAAKCSIMRYADTCTIEAGYDEGTQRTLGSPVMIRVPNKDQKSKDYAQVGYGWARQALSSTERPSCHPTATSWAVSADE